LFLFLSHRQFLIDQEKEKVFMTGFFKKKIIFFFLKKRKKSPLLKMMLLLFILCFISNTLCLNPSISEYTLCESVSNYIELERKRSNTNNAIEEDSFLKELHKECLKDIGCSKLFFQESKKNFTIFKLLLGDVSKNKEFRNDLATKRLFCEKASNWTDLMKRVSMLEIKDAMSNNQLNLICDLNHQLLFDESSLSYVCKCLPNRPCDDKLFPLGVFYFAVILFSIVSIVTGGYHIYKVFVLYRMSWYSNREKTGSKTKATSTNYDSLLTSIS